MKGVLRRILALLAAAALALSGIACGLEDSKPSSGTASGNLTESASPNTVTVGRPTESNRPADPAPPSTGTVGCPEDSPSDVPAEPGGLAIVWNGEARYRIVRGDGETESVRNGAAALANAIAVQSGVALSVVADSEPQNGALQELVVGQNNGRVATSAATAVLSKDAFCIAVYEESVVIVGDSSASTVAAVEYFIQAYVKGACGALVLPKELQVVMSVPDFYTANYDKTVTLKQSYSDYLSDFEETTLISFAEGERGYTADRGGFYDAAHSIDGNGALRWDLQGSLESLTKILVEGSGSFSLNAVNKNCTTFKLWLYVGNTDAVACDHDPINGFQKNQATFYFRAVDRTGRTHCWNHTLTNNGWHEVELSFNVHNGVESGFDYANITGFWIGLMTYDNVTVMIDDLRGVVYHTDYRPQPIENETNARLISDCEYNALDGTVIQEWYGASYDREDRVQGASSLRNCGDASVSDFRTVVANLEISMDASRDELVFFFKTADPNAIGSILIELNEVQDQHELSVVLTPEALMRYGYTGESDVWCEIRIPLTDFGILLHPDLGSTVTLRNFRFCVAASGNGSFDYHIDHVYLAEK